MVVRVTVARFLEIRLLFSVHSQNLLFKVFLHSPESLQIIIAHLKNWFCCTKIDTYLRIEGENVPTVMKKRGNLTECNTDCSVRHRGNQPKNIDDQYLNRRIKGWKDHFDRVEM